MGASVNSSLGPMHQAVTWEEAPPRMAGTTRRTTRKALASAHLSVALSISRSACPGVSDDFCFKRVGYACFNRLNKVLSRKDQKDFLVATARSLCFEYLGR